MKSNSPIIADLEAVFRVVTLKIQIKTRYLSEGRKTGKFLTSKAEGISATSIIKDYEKSKLRSFLSGRMRLVVP